ncbi:TPA: hypothetical protein CPT81_04420 [Candidatus Gastranaerophilales bacterium HUM_20]|nr:unknown [Clostridium sp. CAG:729]DAB21947.1 MAG TPA: hypothetical protein CPT81_04420 [Candidatus Gastranaerophilales bacterium HUM_20]
MKKLLLVSLILTIAGASSAYAAETTYTEQFIQKHTQKIVDKEKQLQEQQKAREEASAKKQEEFKKKIEADRKAREEASNARKQKIEQKKKLFNELISD